MKGSIMGKKLLPIILAGAIIAMLPSVSLAAQMKLEEGTKVTLSLEEQVSAKSAGENQHVIFRVVDDVKAADLQTVLIKAGTKADAEITDVEEPGKIGKPGEMTIRLDKTTAVDGTRVRLRGSLNKEGSNRIVVSAILTALFFPLGLLFLLIKGGDAKANSGLRVTGYVDQDVLVTTP